MKTNDIILKEIDNKDHVELFWETIKNEPTINSMKKEDWVGEFIYDIYYNNNHVGFVAYSNWENTTCCLSCIYIFEPYRRLGIATATIRKIAYMVKDYKILYGFVHKKNPAIDIYPKLGFKFLNKARTGYCISDYKKPNCLLIGNFYEFGKELK